MELSDLQIFKAVADEGGIIRAARRLHRVPSSVTMRIRQLEASLGQALFVRERQRLYLSPQGQALRDYAERLLALADEARHAIASRAPNGTLRLGALESITASRLPAVLAAYHRQYPDVRVELSCGTNDSLVQALGERRIDAAFIVECPDDARFDHLDAFREKLVLITPHDHPPVRRPAELALRSLIAFPAGCAYRRALQRWLGVRDLNGWGVIELTSYHAIGACVAAGTGAAILPESVVALLDRKPLRVHALPARHAAVRTRLAWRHQALDANVRALRELTKV